MSPIAVEAVALRSGTSADWAATNLILGLGELGADTDTGTLKLGDGVTPWADLPASGGGAAADVAAWYFLTGTGLSFNVSHGHTFNEFTDPPRMPAVPGLFEIDGGDPTLLNVLTGGLYEITPTIGLKIAGVTGGAGLARSESYVVVNGGAEAPAYGPPIRTLFPIPTSGAGGFGGGGSMPLVQPLVEGDVVKIETAAFLTTGATGTTPTWNSTDCYVSFRRLGDWTPEA